MRIRPFLASDAVETAKTHINTIRYINSKDYSSKEIMVWSRSSSARKLRNSMKKRIRFVAVENKKIIGFCDFSHDGELTGLYVHKDFQNKGIGLALLKRLEKEAKNQGHLELSLHSTITAKNFYQANGYKVIKKEKFKIKKNYLTVYFMKKKITKTLA